MSIQLATEVAYDTARKEFYKHRLRQDVEREVAQEEALHYGAYFEPNQAEKALHREDEAYEAWKVWALEKTEMSRHQLATAFSESGFVEDDEPIYPTASVPELAAGEETEDVVGPPPT
jgi:small subunit ribosomal protein S23